MVHHATILFALTIGVAAAFVRVDLSAKPVPQMVDDFGRQLLFHGVNVVYKIPPFYPSRDSFDPDNSLCTEDIIFLRNNGFNVVRLFVSWAAVEIMPGIYNTTYLAVIRSIVNELAQYNVSTILDCHQVGQFLLV